MILSLNSFVWLEKHRLISKITRIIDLVGTLNQSFNQLRRNVIKLSLPIQYVRLAHIADERSLWQFYYWLSGVLKKGKSNESIADKRVKSTEEKETLLSTTIVKLQSLFQDPEEDTGSTTLCKKVKPVSELQQQLQLAAEQCREGQHHQSSSWKPKKHWFPSKIHSR